MEKLRLRFRSDDATTFSDWTEMCLEDVGEIRTGTTPNIKDLKNIGGSYLWVTPTDITGKEVTVTATTLSKEGMDVAREIPANSVLVTCIASIGKNCVLRKKGSCNQQINSITPKFGYDVDFLYYLICRKESVLHSFAGHGGMEILNKSEFSKLIFKFPSFEEQQKIAAFFTALDEKISLTREKISSIRTINTKLVADALSGEIRFSSANGQPFPDWKYERLGQSFSVKMCKRIFKEETCDNGDIPFYKIGTFGGKADSYITNELFESYKKKYSYPSKGDTLISCSGTVGRCVIFDGSPSYFQDSNIVWLEPNDKNFEYDRFYLTSVLKNLRWDSLSSSTIKRIYSKDLLEKEWLIPCLDEQRLIAEFIAILNKKLAMENEKLSSLMKLKMAFMQQMFV